MSFTGTSGAFAIFKNIASEKDYFFLQENSNVPTFGNFIKIDNSYLTIGIANSDYYSYIKISEDYEPVVAFQKSATYGIQTTSGVPPLTVDKINKNVYAGLNLTPVGTKDLQIDKLSKDGDYLFEFKDSSVAVSGSNNYRAASSITSNNDVYFTAGLFNDKANSTDDYYKHYITKYTGNVKSNQFVIGSNTGTLPRHATIAYNKMDQIEYDANGDLLYCLNFGSFDTATNFYTLAKINGSNNAIFWSTTLTTGNFIKFATFVQDDTSNIICCFNLLTGNNETSIQFAKFGSNGFYHTSKRIDSRSSGSDIATDGSNIYFVGTNFGGNNRTVGIFKLDSDLNKIYGRNLVATSNTTFSGLSIVYNDGNILISGNATSPLSNATSSSYIIKLPADGTILGNGTYNMHGNLTLTYSNSNVTVSVLALNPISGNLTLVNANSTTYTSNPAFAFNNNISNTTVITL